MQKRSPGHSLVEMLAAIAIVGILVALLLPAIQSAREAARRMQCQNHLHQMGIALHHYHDVSGRFPSGITLPSRTFWSGHLLPFLEQDSLYATLAFDGTWNAGWNEEACGTYLSVFRCPSSTAPRHLTAQGIRNRVPCDYLACTSGTVRCESGPSPLAGRPDSDGMFFLNSGVRLADLLDGASTTVAVSETVFLYQPSGKDHEGAEQYLDHWYIGTLEGYDNEVSEAMGSTGAPINAYRLPVFVDEKELGFSSRHPGGVQVLFAGGAVSFVSETIDRDVWSAMGTRASGDVVGRH